MPSPVNIVIFLYWVGPVPYLELFWVGPVKKITLYIFNLQISPKCWQDINVYITRCAQRAHRHHPNETYLNVKLSGAKLSGVKLSTVSNCLRCQIVRFYIWCQIVHGVKLSWCQIVPVSNCPGTREIQ